MVVAVFSVCRKGHVVVSWVEENNDAEAAANPITEKVPAQPLKLVLRHSSPTIRVVTLLLFHPHLFLHLRHRSISSPVADLFKERRHDFVPELKADPSLLVRTKQAEWKVALKKKWKLDTKQ
jgi:hypothetical protein